MATGKSIPPVTPKTRNTMFNHKYAAQVVDTVNQITQAEVRIGTGPSQLAHTLGGKTVIHISREEIVKMLQDGGYI